MHPENYSNFDRQATCPRPYLTVLVWLHIKNYDVGMFSDSEMGFGRTAKVLADESNNTIFFEKDYIIKLI